ncbi:branched-chain amino acid ABC transporter permease [Amycolatopsis antarctica]|uniref:Branched-chain amino acid ABC transporter permease n=1 Tax=Amycolatopsis antarctica TaxID=1854586 RepID=A0A263CWD0_9PSEU|nr:branched-chain amino acid ABC transporter permease [Amycolatopsis antarctica]
MDGRAAERLSAASGPGTLPTRFADPRLRAGLFAAGLAALLAAPLFGLNNSALLLLSTVFMWVGLTSSWNIISGFTGYVDFGHGAFFGIGGYTAGLLVTKSGMSFWTTVPIAMLFGFLFALVVGYPLLRLRGVYFSIAMLGAFMAMRELALVFRDFTGGSGGVIFKSVIDRGLFYYVFLGIAVAVVLLTVWLRRSQLGASMLAVRENEVGAEARGINTTLVKMTAFCMSGAITALIGSLWAYQTAFIDPSIMFRDILLINLALMVTLGGLGTVWGPALGATVFILLRETLWGTDGEDFLVFFGIALVIVVLLLPKGIVGTLADRATAGRRKREREAGEGR